jgi:ribosomal protein L12E/L44/L45/RPP1/RPP2
MAPHLKFSSPADYGQVNLSSLSYWCNELSCTEEQLKEATAAVGTQPDQVRTRVMILKLQEELTDGAADPG